MRLLSNLVAGAQQVGIRFGTIGTILRTGATSAQNPNDDDAPDGTGDIVVSGRPALWYCGDNATWTEADNIAQTLYWMD